VAQGMAITATRKNRMMIRRCGSYVFQFSGARRQETTFLIEFKPSLTVLVEGTCERSHRSGMPSSEDYRQLAERCIRLAKACTRPAVAEQLMTFAANYLELAEQALRLSQPATAVRQQINIVQKSPDDLRQFVK
jgi:hypothetical protein